VREPAADLGVVAAVLSNVREAAVQPAWAFFGEVGLGGEVRRVAHTEKRLHELARLGFTRAVTARAAVEGIPTPAPIAATGLSHVEELAELLRCGENAV